MDENSYETRTKHKLISVSHSHIVTSKLKPGVFDESYTYEWSSQLLVST